MSDYKKMIDNLRSNQNNTFQLEAADAIEQLVKEVSFLTKECDSLSAQCGRSATKNTNLQIEYDILAKMYETVSKERDAAVADLKSTRSCQFCRNMYTVSMEDEPCNSCECFGRAWEWRGVQEEGNGTEI